MDGGAWRAAVHRVRELGTTVRSSSGSGERGLEPDFRAGSRRASLARSPGCRLPARSDPGPGWTPLLSCFLPAPVTALLSREP